MARLGNTIVVADHPDTFSALPEGKYNVQIQKTEIKRNKAGTGSYAAYEMRVLDGQYANRVVFYNINVDHPSKQAVDIGNREHARLAEACGLDHIDDTDDVNGKTVTITLSVEKDGSGNERNNVKKVAPYMNAALAPSSAPKFGSVAKPQTPASSGSPAPWAR